MTKDRFANQILIVPHLARCIGFPAVNGDRELAIFHIGVDQGGVVAKMRFALFRIDPVSIKRIRAKFDI